jgi:hypothetical protein
MPVPRGHALLQRTDPNVEAVARFVLDAALNPRLAPQLRPASRCGVLRTRQVTTRTTLLLVRYRFRLELPSRTGLRTLIAEHAGLIAFRGSGDSLTQVGEEDTQRLVAATADANVPPDQARDFAQRALDSLDTLIPLVDARGEQLAEHLRDSHRRVRAATGDMKRGLTVTLQRPADVLGVYVYLPAGGAR